MHMRTGFEMVIPQKTSSTFIGKTKQEGIVTDIDTKLKLVTVKYRDNTVDVFEYGDIRGEASGMAVNHPIDIMPDLKVGSRVSAGQIIVYHKQFFKFDPTTKQLSWCHGIPATVAIMPKDVTLEDSSMISSKLSKLLSMDSIYARPIQISTDMVIDEFADVGSNVGFNDTLIRLKYEETADIIGDVDELFDDLKQIEYRSKTEGTIVGIQVYCVSDNLNPSLTRFINNVTYNGRRKANVARGTVKDAAMSMVTVVPDGTRIRGIQLSSVDVLIIFHIKAKIDCGIGDKVVFSNGALKSVIGRIEERPMVTEGGREIDAVFGCNSIFDRIILGVLISGVCDTVLESAQKDVLSMYFDEA